MITNPLIRAVRTGGIIQLIGILSGAASEVLLSPILMQNVRVQGVIVGPRQAFENMCRAFEAHEVRPIVDRTFPFDQAREAFEHIASAKHFGKIVISA